MKTFFRALPAKLKIILHVIEMLFSLYVTTALTLMGTGLGIYLGKYLPVIAITFLIAYPPVRLAIQCWVGVPGTSPEEADPLSQIKRASRS